MNNNFLDATVVLPVENAKETAIFYKNKLGFEINGVWETEDKSLYGSVKRGNVTIEFGERRKKYAGTGICFIHVENVDKIFNEFKIKNIEFIGNLDNRDYGNKDFRIKDNNGNILIIASTLNDQNKLLKNNKVL